MTALVQSSADRAGESAKSCDMCGHPAAAHDAIAERYCRATLTSALPRTCICR